MLSPSEAFQIAVPRRPAVLCLKRGDRRPPRQQYDLHPLFSVALPKLNRMKVGENSFRNTTRLNLNSPCWAFRL